MVRGLAVDERSLLASRGVILPFASRIRARMPATRGVACDFSESRYDGACGGLTIDVPEITAYPPWDWIQVDRMLRPGAAISGFMSSSQVGPQLL